MKRQSSTIVGTSSTKASQRSSSSRRRRGTLRGACGAALIVPAVLTVMGPVPDGACPPVVAGREASSLA